MLERNLSDQDRQRFILMKILNYDPNQLSYCQNQMNHLPRHHPLVIVAFRFVFHPPPEL